jgi:hypothetical protein
MCNGKSAVEWSNVLSHGNGKWKMRTIAPAQKPINRSRS